MQEFEQRLQNFIKAEDFIANFNTRNDVLMQVSHNKFSDWFDEEYQSLLGAKVDNLPQAPTEITQSFGYFSDTVDWRNSGAVNQIVD